MFVMFFRKRLENNESLALSEIAGWNNLLKYIYCLRINTWVGEGSCHLHTV